MKRYLLLIILSLYLAGCAAYKHLEPEPAISPLEAGYIEIQKDDKLFELDKDKKYYMTFPAPDRKNFYIVLDFENSALFNSYFTNTFDDGKGRIIEIPDQAAENDTLSVYPVDNSYPQYFWVIDLVKAEFMLDVKYRYAPQWRFKFETQYETFKEILADNRADRSNYEALGTTFHFENFDFDESIQSLDNKQNALKQLKQRLLDIEKIFPENILNTTDEAYQNYQSLKKQVDEELQFQSDYLTVLKFFKKERETRGDTEAFVGALPEFIDFLNQQKRFHKNVISEAKYVIGNRLDEITPYYEKILQAKNDAGPIDLETDKVKALYRAAGKSMEDDFAPLAAFIENYNSKVEAISQARNKVNDIEKQVEQNTSMPGNVFFSDILSRLSKIQYSLPKSGRASFGKYRNYTCVTILEREITRLNNKINTMLRQYREADRLVPKLNALKNQKQYNSMLRLLKQNSQLDFMKNMYAGIDQLSLDEQANRIKQALRNQNWRAAEDNLKALHQDRDFLNPQKIMPKKQRLVKSLEDSLFIKIDRISRSRANQFVNENIKTLDNVEGLYQNPVFTPVHEMTFTSGNQSALQKRNQDLYGELNHLKNEVFPRQAISALYEELTRNPDNNGVLKARAIVVHGSHYTGDDSRIKNRVAESDPWASKWITSPKEYRRVFALPTTTNPQGENTYVFRLNIRIPSEAKFPVFDITIKLPDDVADEAGSRQWYEQITMNKEVLKNEGRFTITAPTSLNDYECQIGPVRMDKDGDNVLEVRFKDNSFKVYQVSVMAQKPIIKKH